MTVEEKDKGGRPPHVPDDKTRKTFGVNVKGRLFIKFYTIALRCLECGPALVV